MPNLFHDQYTRAVLWLELDGTPRVIERTMSFGALAFDTSAGINAKSAVFLQEPVIEEQILVAWCLPVQQGYTFQCEGIEWIVTNLRLGGASP